MRILIIEDEAAVAEFIRRGLSAASLSVDVAHDGARGSYLARTNEYDCVLIDNVLPDISGKDVCRQIREAGNTVPIIILSALSEVPTKVDVLEAGADDYVTKPFSFDELIARVKALQRRPRHLLGSVLSIDTLSMDTKRCSVERDGHSIYLTRKEFALLEYFLRNPGIVLSRSQIMEHVWDLHTDPFSNTIESHILSLRRKIERPKQHKLIHTVPGRGYKIDVVRKEEKALLA